MAKTCLETAAQQITDMIDVMPWVDHAEKQRLIAIEHEFLNEINSIAKGSGVSLQYRRMLYNNSHNHDAFVRKYCPPEQ